MQKSVEQFAALNKRSVESALGAWQIAIKGLEEVSRLNIEATRALLAEASEQGQNLPQIKTFQDVTSFTSGFAGVSFDRVLGYSRNFQKIAAETQAESAKWFKATSDDVKSGMTSILEGVATTAPQPSKDAAYAALQGATALTDSLIEAAQKAVKQSTDFADAAINATVEVVSNTRSKKS